MIRADSLCAAHIQSIKYDFTMTLLLLVLLSNFCDSCTITSSSPSVTSNRV